MRTRSGLRKCRTGRTFGTTQVCCACVRACRLCARVSCVRVGVGSQLLVKGCVGWGERAVVARLVLGWR